MEKHPTARVNGLDLAPNVPTKCRFGWKSKQIGATMPDMDNKSAKIIPLMR